MGRLLGQFLGGSFTQAAPTGTVDGVNSTFTIASAPASAAAFLLHVNGLLQTQGTDYTLSGTTITMTTAPELGSALLAYFLKTS